MRLSDLPKGTLAVVEHVTDAHADDFIARRLRDLGFVSGEPVRVVARGPWGADPLLIQIGSTRFALRRAEAGRVSIRPAQATRPVSATSAANTAGTTVASTIAAGATGAPGMTLALSEPTDSPCRP